MSWNNFWSKITKFLKTNQSDSTICKEIRSTKRRKCSNMYVLGTIYGPWMYYFDDENTLYIDHLHHMLYPDTCRAEYQGSLVLIHTKVRIHVYIYILFFLFTTFLVQFKRFVPAKVNANGQAKLLFNLNEVDNSTAVIGTQHWSNSPIAMGFLGGGNSNIWFFTAKIGGNDPIWLIFFRWIETTNHLFQLTWTRMSDLANKFWILRVPGRLDTVDGRNLAWA